jgi:enoyl-CoA hydratase
MKEYRTIKIRVDDDGIAVCTFNRPDVHNALNEEMVDELHAFLDAAPRLEDINAVIFTGAGEKAFLAGVDIRELLERTAADALRRINTTLFRRVEQLALPTVAAVRGYALGGGLEFAMACDLRVCGEGSKLGQPEVALGIIPAAGATYRLPRLVGLGRAKELIYTGRIIDAAEAHAIGLVNRVVPDGEVLDAARELARTVTRNSPLAVRLAKVSVNAAADVGVDDAMALESASQAVLFDDDDKKRRMTEFLEKRNKK